MPELAVLIPTTKRADVLPALVENIAEATEITHRIYLIVENSDKETLDQLWHLKGGHISVFGNFGSCSKAMNAGYLASVEPFLFTGNDDLRWHEGWDIEALSVMDDQTHIVGTNDGNGRMTCFAMVRRSYIEQHSGVFDKPNTLYHPYESQYVDTELAEYAKHRGVWGEAHESLTEHLHHEFGKADANHPNYRKAAATCAQDHQTFQHRRELWTKSPGSA